MAPPLLPDWVAGYIGIPFRPHGRNHDGCDCWGLLRLVLAERFDTQIPAFHGMTWQPGDDRRALAEYMDAHLDVWIPVVSGQERPGDGVLLRVLGHPIHVGVVIISGWMLHVEGGADAAVEPYIDIRWNRRVLGFYRYKGIPQ
jgi:cell wall-associated NlpC family hydrolase